MLEGIKVVDLSAPLGPDTVMWPGAPAPSADTLVTIADNGYFARLLHVFEHSGTHFDAPCHMVADTAAVDEVPVESLVAQVRVIDISSAIGDDADGLLTVEQVQAHEAEHGPIPGGSAVFLRTGWEDRNTDAEAYAGPPGDLHFPGFGVPAAQYLVDAGVVGLGIDTLGIDAGCADTFPVHKTVSHSVGVWHLENLTNLKALPASGAWVIVGVPKLVGGSGCPARVIALVP